MKKRIMNIVSTVIFAIVLIGKISGCASIQKNVDQSKLIVQAGTMKVIEADIDNAAERAAKVKAVASEGQRFLDGTDVSVPLLAAAINARLAELNLQPSDRLLAAALVDAVVAELNTRVGDGLLSAEQKYTVSQVLGWIEQAASFY